MKINNEEKSKKNKNVIVILDIVLIVVAIILAIFLAVIIKNKNASSEDDVKFISEEVSVNIDDSKMSEYSSKALGIKFKYYNELDKVSDVTENSIFLNAAMFRTVGNEGINVIIGKMQETLEFEDYIYSHIYGILNTNDIKAKDIEVIKDNVKMGGLDSFKVRYKSGDINFYQMMVQKDGKEYIMTYSAEDLYFDKQRAEDMFSTFEFLDN